MATDGLLAIRKDHFIFNVPNTLDLKETLGTCFGESVKVVGTLIYNKGRKLMECFPLSFGNQWKDWEVRILVLVSLILQMVLISFGKQRKFTSRRSIRIVLWCAYLMADSVATFVLGVISKNLWDVKDDQDKYLLEITAFWAPFLLLHLGGPDTITAYSLEDNELWLRHLLALGFQSVAVIYIWIVAGTDSQLCILSILMFFPGIIKYGERIWVLWLASNGKLRESLLPPPDPGPNYYKFSREYTLKQSEGYHVTVEEIGDQSMIPFIENEFIPDGAELVTAYDLLQIFKYLFADLILSFDDRNHSQSLFNKISSDKAFRMIEMELGFMYDILYTKATVINSSIPWLDSSHIQFVFHYYCVEVYAIFLLLSSDWTRLWLTKHETTCIGQAISFIQRPEQPRWSNSMSQFNLLSFSLKDKQTICYGIQKLLRIDKMLENNRYTTCEAVTVDLKEIIFEYLKEKFDHLKRSSNDESVLRTLCSFRAGEVLEKFNHNELDWSIQGQFDKIILIWHIATDLCYHLDWKDQEPAMSNVKFSNWLSQYMLYLLVICPSMLPMGIGMIRLQDTCAEDTRFF
ncbi:uncharacterized protein LOC142633545 [Castanea sativa]|uniref:uncharacterized protein LOC142633545 n=1 Tax=Castanea sativa TaxID=21020 RepID=UPI003F6524E5